MPGLPLLWCWGTLAGELEHATLFQRFFLYGPEQPSTIPRELSHKMSWEDPLVLMGGAPMSVSVIGYPAEYP